MSRALLCLATPFLVLWCEPRTELLTTAVAVAVFLVPGVVGVHALLPRSHPWGRYPASLGVSAVASLALFGLVAAVATKLHWRFPTFLWIYATCYLIAIGLGLVRLVRRRDATMVEEQPSLLSSSQVRTQAHVVLQDLDDFGRWRTKGQ